MNVIWSLSESSMFCLVKALHKSHIWENSLEENYDIMDKLVSPVNMYSFQLFQQTANAYITLGGRQIQYKYSSLASDINTFITVNSWRLQSISRVLSGNSVVYLHSTRSTHCCSCFFILIILKISACPPSLYFPHLHLSIAVSCKSLAQVEIFCLSGQANLFGSLHGPFKHLCHL